MEKFIVFNEIISDYIAEKNITINAFSNLIGTSENVVADWFKGKTFPTIESVLKVANYLDCSLDYLFGLSPNVSYKKSLKNDGFFTRFLYLKNIQGLTSYMFSKKSGISQSTISKWKKGKQPKTENILTIAEFFNCSLDFLIGRSDLI